MGERADHLRPLSCTWHSLCQVRAGNVEGERGGITVFVEGTKVSALTALGFKPEPMVTAAANRDQLGLMVAFDLWVLNVDRGAHNVFVIVEDGRPYVRLIDHGHTLLLPRTDKGADPAPADWEAFVDSDVLETAEMMQRLLSNNYLKQFVGNDDILAGAKVISENVSTEVIDVAVEAVPEEFFFSDRSSIGRLLRKRKERLPAHLGEVK
jgi:hypothetical protein